MTFNESDLIAYQLHELSPRRTRALRRALAADPALAAEAEAIAWTLRAFSHAPAPAVDAATLDRNWNSLRPSLAVLTPAAPSFWRRPLTLGAGLALAAAAVIGVAFLTTQHIPVRTPSNVALNAAPSTAQPSISASSNAGASTTSAFSSSTASSRNLSPRPQSAFSADGAGRPTVAAAGAAQAAGTTRDTLNAFDALPSSDAHNIPAATATTAAAPATARNSAVQPINTAASAVPVQPATISQPLQASITNSVPLQRSAQTLHTYSASTIVPPKPRATHESETDVSLGGFAALASASNATDNDYVAAAGSQPGTETTTQTIAPAGGFLVAVHHQVRPYAGYQVVVGYSRQAFNTATTNSSGTQGSFVPADAYEISAAYVVRGPHTHRISTHAAAGAGALDFVPTSGAANSHHVLRPAGLFTLGLDYHIKRRWSLRAEYRALFFKSPNLMNTTVTGYTVSSEPTISLNYRLDSLVRP